MQDDDFWHVRFIKIALRVLSVLTDVLAAVLVLPSRQLRQAQIYHPHINDVSAET